MKRPSKKHVTRGGKVHSLAQARASLKMIRMNKKMKPATKRKAIATIRRQHSSL